MKRSCKMLLQREMFIGRFSAAGFGLAYKK
jgi:hypothetical protein